ncbi:MAG: DUF59 domain-containing protein [Planctomycetes bacterium]|nr:DUF59 domain-containing protein [Planctomycetota bacterium]
MSVNKDQVVDVLKNVFDPEMPVDIWNFGLIYHVNVDDGGKVDIVMTLTSESCPSAKQIPSDVKKKVEQLTGVATCDVTVTFDPKWTPQRITPEGKKVLGLDEE